MTPAVIGCLVSGVAIAAALAFFGGVFAGTYTALDALFGRRLRALDEGGARRHEARQLDAGRWPPLARLWQGAAPVAARWAPAVRWARDGEVTRVAPGLWQVGTLADGAPLRFVHRSDVPGLEGRAVQIGDGPRMDLASFVDRWGAAALREAARPAKEAGYREPSSVQAAFVAAAPLLGSSALPPPHAGALAEVPALVAFVAPHLGLVPLSPDERPTLAEAFARFAARQHELGPTTLSDFAPLFPEHATAAGWVALTDPEPRTGVGVEPLTLYLASEEGPRIVALAFAHETPWIVGDHHGAAALLVDGLLEPAVERALGDVLDRTRRALRIDAPR